MKRPANGALPALHDPGWTRPDIAEIASVIATTTGLAFPSARVATVEAAIARAFDGGRYDGAEGFVRTLLADRTQLDDLVSQLTVGETYFFREPQQFEFLRQQVFPEVAARPAHRSGLRVWSAGCATGEEAYSVAIALRELGLGSRAHVLGTDLSRSRLEKARAAIYRSWSMRGVPEPIVARYFDRGADGTLALSDDIRQSVELRYLNLAEDTYPAISTGVWGMDVILCRNVLIYFDAATITRVATRLLASLADEGWLFLGATDPPLQDIVPCEVVSTAAGVAYRRRGDRHDSRSSPVELERVPRPSATSAPPDPTLQTPDSTHAPPGVSGETSDLELAYAALDYERAVDLARERCADDLGDARAWIVLTRALANLGRLSDAGEVCATALDRHRMNAEVAYLHAVLLMQANRFADALSAARGALYLDPSLIVAHLTAGSASARIGDAARARRAFDTAERLLALMPADAIVPASDGEPAARLLEMARLQARLTLAGST